MRDAPRSKFPRWQWLLPVILCSCGDAAAETWKPLVRDGLHDPNVRMLELLQDPAEALSVLPPDSAGNKVDWVKALNDGYIKPRSSLGDDKPVQILEGDILMNKDGGTPMVRFPHKVHTQWLDCGNCHEKLFKAKAGATPITMRAILEGEYCGVCHGAVSFPLTECSRCHTGAPR